MQMKHIFWHTGPSSTVLACFTSRVTRGQNVVLRWIGAEGHFRSRDKDIDHTIWFAIAENSLLYSTAHKLSYCRLKFYIAGIGNFANFSENSGEKLKFSLRTAKLTQTCRNTFSGPLSTVIACMLPEYTCCQGAVFYAESVGVVTFSHVKKMAVTPFDPQLSKTPRYVNCTTLSFIEPELLPTFYVLATGHFEYFFAKIVENIKIFHLYRR